MIITIIGTICAILLGFFNARLRYNETYIDITLTVILLIAMIALGLTSSIAAEEDIAPWIKAIGGYIGIYIPMYMSQRITDAYYQEKSPKIFYLFATIFIIICVAIYALGYCGFSSLLYALAGLAILGIALIIEIIQTFGSLIYQMFKKN